MINGRIFDVTGFFEKEHLGRRIVGFDFQVTHESYHDVTVLLYENDFRVEIPSLEVDFQAVIHNYFTSFTNLYEEGAVGDFHLELIEKR
ncbi:hypothetical protein B0X71_01670 [Planococcus lenghuensis]|uniref:DUF3219 family protein n=2 Tax=Planococcus lenghuensis TaxID=2213202 RepID=A0A1Q2L3E8_9BACL|nr:hypothetical protein B0X71_01670 [Planococcus lenghuensis]